MSNNIFGSLINVNLPIVDYEIKSAPVLSGCQVRLSDEVKPYSELDESNYYFLNNNDYGFGFTMIDMCFNNLKISYSEFFVQCVAIRADNQIICKIDKNFSVERFRERYYCKVNQFGKHCLGIGYFFRTSEEKEILLNCKSFCIEGAIALNSKYNVYGFMCMVEKVQKGWKLCEGNTYTLGKHININNLYH